MDLGLIPELWLPANQGLLVAGMAKGYVLHEGSSPFDGKPIVSIATLHSSNRTTGDMVQTLILQGSASVGCGEEWPSLM